VKKIIGAWKKQGMGKIPKKKTLTQQRYDRLTINSIGKKKKESWKDPGGMQRGERKERGTRDLERVK